MAQTHSTINLVMQARFNAVMSLISYVLYSHIIPLSLMVCATQFPDSFRMDVYWLSLTGSLLGILPCLGQLPHSFFSLSLPPCLSHDDSSDGSQELHPGGVHVFFDDGLGGICCLRPQDVLL